jgi:hypothetical protein
MATIEHFLRRIKRKIYVSENRTFAAKKRMNHPGFEISILYPSSTEKPGLFY